MPGSVASVFSEAEEFEAALRPEGWRGLLVTGRGRFQARLTQVALDSLRLSAAEEQLARVAHIAVPADTILVSFAISGASPPLWAGSELSAREMITVSAGERLHARTVAQSSWGAIRLPEQVLLGYGGMLTGTAFAIPPGMARWRPAAAAWRDLRQLHRAAIRTALARPRMLADPEAAHGLEQQMINALIECMAPATAEEESLTDKRHRDILARFEKLLKAGRLRSLPAICAELGISERLLRECCRVCLGLSPSEYSRRRAMQQINRELRNGNAATSIIAEIAKRHGFKSLGRFARDYRAVYGELPSDTLRSPHGIARISLGRQRE